MGRARTVDDARIISAARWLFLMRGNAVSTSAIARNVGIAESALYKRFGTKEALFFAAMTPPPVDVDDVLGPRSAMAEIMDQEGARKWLAGVARALVALCAENLPAAWCVLGATEPERHLYEQWWRADPCRTVEKELARRLATLSETGHVTVREPHAAAQLLLAAARDVVFREAMLPASVPSIMLLERRIDALFEQLWAGLASRRRVGGWEG